MRVFVAPGVGSCREKKKSTKVFCLPIPGITARMEWNGVDGMDE